MLYLGGFLTELRHEIVIQAPAEKVWKILADLESVQHYNPTVKTAKYISSNREGIGASRECELKPKGIAKERIIEWVPGKAMTVELFESDWPVKDMQWRTEVTALGNQTRVSQLLQYRPKGLLGGVMNFLIMKRMINGSVSKVFQGLKSYSESRG